MRYKILGNTNENVPAVGQGCMGIGGYLSRDDSRAESHVTALKTGIELGMNFIDTAEDYGAGHSEELVGRAIKGIRDKVFIATKVSPQNLHSSDLLQSAEGSLRRLGTDYIDLYQIHWPNSQILIEETMSAMTRLLEEGKIRYIGVSNFSLSELKEAQRALPRQKIISTQVEHSLMDRTIEVDTLPYCERNGITKHAGWCDQAFGRHATRE